MQPSARLAATLAVCSFVAGCAGAAPDETGTLAAPRYVESGSGATGTTTTTSGTATTTATTTTTAAATVACGPDRHALEGQLCTPGAETCRPPGWTCECAQRFQPNCGGAAMRPMPLPAAWACTPVVATADRGDGCPFEVPADGTACAREGTTCGYDLDDCGFHSAAARCARGSWTVEHLMRPPPP